jgi:succinate dehydrogenase/fumarate reductase cytochrome b subunit
MPTKNINYYLIKAARISGWLLLFLMILYILTGFSLCGEYGFGKLIHYQLALGVHKVFEWPLIAAFLVHSSVTIYFAFRRWGWIKKRAKH